MFCPDCFLIFGGTIFLSYLSELASLNFMPVLLGLIITSVKYGLGSCGRCTVSQAYAAANDRLILRCDGCLGWESYWAAVFAAPGLLSVVPTILTATIDGIRNR